MKILVTGGAGFIGSHIVDAYIKEGHDVIIIDDLSNGRKENLNPKAKFYKTDICSKKVVNILKTEKPELLNHHAAQIDVRHSVNNPINDIEVNVTGLVKLVESGKEYGLKKIILASSGGTVYGEQKEFPATEEHPTWPISPYGLNKLMSEKYLYYFRKQYGLSYAALRYANVYGPRQNPHGEAGVIAIFINALLNGKQPIINGDGMQTRDYIFIDDVVSANIKALNHNICGSFNIGTGIQTDVKEIFSKIKNILNINFAEKHGPAKEGEQLQSSISPKLFEKETGWKINVSLDDGLEKTTKWFKNRNKV